jgi:hypothetical protein
MSNFKSTSRYANGLVATNRSGKNFLVLRSPLQLVESSGDIFVTITADIANRPDLISQKAYGNPELWWVIYEFNGIRDPMFDLKPGTVLRIPELERVLIAIQALEE